MFTNFLYLLIALIIYTSSELFENSYSYNINNLLGFLCISIIFIIFCNLLFKKSATNKTKTDLDILTSNYISRLSTIALIVFSINIYIFKLPLFFEQIKIFDLIPTFKAALFLCLFLFYLVVIWDASYASQKNILSNSISKKSYILSNIGFCLPALLPWLFLSFFADILGLVSEKHLNQILKKPWDEIGYIVFFLSCISIFGPLLIKKFWNCKPLEQSYIRDQIENTCKKAKLKYADILTWNLFGGTMITAGVMGIVGRFRYILVTPALLTTLSTDEINAVIFHETGHVKKNHILFYLLFFTGFAACNYLLFEPIMLLLYVFSPAYSLFDIMGITKSTGHSILISISLIGFFIIYFRFVFGFFMRNFERQADLYIYDYYDSSSSLISAFYKIASFSGQSIEKPNWHHFSIAQRINFLKQCQANPSLIKNHHKFINKLILAYLIIVTAFIFLGFSINYGMTKKAFQTYITQNIVLQKFALNPDNVELYNLVANFYYENANYKKAIDVYENILQIDPQNIIALNNLSWLFSTCPLKKFLNKKKALNYATLALKYDRKPLVLDTYAQALLINNDIKNAVKALQEAITLLNKRTANKEYYEKRLKEFKKKVSKLKMLKAKANF